MEGKQLGFDDYEQSTAKKQTNRKKFFAKMEQVVPWQPLIDLIVPFYPKRGFKGASADGAVGGVVRATSTGRQALQLCLQALPKPVLYQGAEIIDEIIVGAPDGAHAIALAAHQSGTLQLAQLTADVGLGEAGGFDQAGDIHGAAVLELTEQLQASRLAQQAEELAEFLQQLRTGHRTGGTHGEWCMTMKALCVIWALTGRATSPPAELDAYWFVNMLIHS